jgi:hypothetical protein
MKPVPFVLLLLVARPLSGQVVVPVHEEPRHHLVVDQRALRILDVQIPPGDTTLFHTHDTPIHYVLISAAVTVSQTLGQEWTARGSGAQPARAAGDAWWSLDYGERPLTHRVANVGSTVYHLIGITNRAPGPTSGQIGAANVVPGEVEAESRWFRRTRLTLPVGGEARLQGRAGPVLAVQVTAGRLDVVAATGSTRRTSAAGGWLLQEADQAYRLLNPGTGPVTLVLVQVLK